MALDRHYWPSDRTCEPLEAAWNMFAFSCLVLPANICILNWCARVLIIQQISLCFELCLLNTKKLNFKSCLSFYINLCNVFFFIKFLLKQIKFFYSNNFFFFFFYLHTKYMYIYCFQCRIKDVEKARCTTKLTIKHKKLLNN